MPLDPSYFDYPHRSYGMDHDFYDWSMLTDRKPVEWPGKAELPISDMPALQISFTQALHENEGDEPRQLELHFHKKFPSEIKEACLEFASRQ